jgi:RNA recognition motif-containing protein
MVFPLEDKEVYLERPNQPRLEDAIPRFKKELGIPDYTKQIEELERKLIIARDETYESSQVEEKKEEVKQSAYPDKISLRVSNLPDISEDELKQLFAPLYASRKIKRLFRPTFRDSGEYRDFAFVHFDTMKDANEAIAMYNGKKVEKMIIKVEFAAAPKRRDPPPAAKTTT